jgi:hypothetical protein
MRRRHQCPDPLGVEASERVEGLGYRGAAVVDAWNDVVVEVDEWGKGRHVNEM